MRPLLQQRQRPLPGMSEVAANGKNWAAADRPLFFLTPAGRFRGGSIAAATAKCLDVVAFFQAGFGKGSGDSRRSACSRLWPFRCRHLNVRSRENRSFARGRGGQAAVRLTSQRRLELGKQALCCDGVQTSSYDILQYRVGFNYNASKNGVGKSASLKPSDKGATAYSA